MSEQPEPSAADAAAETVAPDGVAFEAAVAPLEAPETPATPRRRTRSRRVLLALLAVLLPVGLVGGAAGALLAWDASYEGRILPGVHVGGVDLSGMDRAGATAAIAAAYPYGEGRLVLRAPESDLTITYADIGRRPAVDELVDAAMAAGRTGEPLDRAIGQVRQALDGIVIAPRVVYDATALEGQVAVAMATLHRAAVDATITMGDAGPLTTPARTGQAVDPGPIAVAAAEAVAPADARAEVVVEVVPVAVAPKVEDGDVAEAAIRTGRLVSDVVVTFRDKHWTIRAATVRGWVRYAVLPDGSVTPVIDTSAIAASLRKPTKAVLKPAVNALFLKGRGGRVVGVVASRDGRELNVSETVARIAAELEARALGTPSASVAVVTTKLIPKLTTEEARKTAPVMSRLSRWTTYFPISERNYFGANIWRPAQIIDGTVLAPGQRFDWWDAIWPVTTARGFGPGGIIRTDHTDPTGALGGGMCSSSTTLFNAALRAGLQMGARSNHKYYINRYPLGLDATVSVIGNSRQTMSFTNDTRHPIVIRAFKIRHGSRGYVRYEIWGVGDGRTVSLSRASVSNVRKATTTIVEVTTLPPGVREQTEYPSNGMDVSVTRVVRNANGRVIHRDTYRTHYVLWNGRIEVGRRL